LKPLLDKRVVIKQLDINEPDIRLFKTKDVNDSLIWNFEYILKTEKPEIDTVKKEFDWKIECNKFNMTGGHINIQDSLKSSAEPSASLYPDRFNLNNFDISNINIILSGLYSEEIKEFEISKLNFKTNTQFNLNDFSANIKIADKSSTDIKSFKLTTDSTNILINKAFIAGFDPFNFSNYEDMADYNVEFSLIADRFNVHDLKYFLPHLNFLNGKYFVKIEANGKYNDITLQNLILNTDYTTININGKVKNLTAPEKLYLDVNLNESKIEPGDVKNCLPGIDIPDYSHVGTVYTDIKFTGEPLNFSSGIDIRTGSGNITGDVKLDLRNNNISYKTDLFAKSINIGKIIKDDNLKSTINMNLKADGRGTDINTLAGKFDFTINNSEIYGQNIRAAKGIVTANSMNFDIKLDYSSNTLTTNLEGKINLKNIKNPDYQLNGSVKSLDISTISHNTQDKSDLNFSFNIKGSGIDVDDVSGNYNFRIFPSIYGIYPIPETPLDLTFIKTEGIKSITLASKFVDFKAEGNFKITSIPQILLYNLESITQELEDVYEHDTTKVAGQKSDKENYEPVDTKMRYISDKFLLSSPSFFNYSIKVKDLLPLRLIMKDSSFSFTAISEGIFHSDKNKFNFGNVTSIKELKYRDSLINLKEAELRLDLNSSSEGKLLDSISFISLRVKDLLADGNKFDNVNINTMIKKGDSRFLISVNQDTLILLNTVGNFNIENKFLKLQVDSLLVKYVTYRLQNFEPLTMDYNFGDTLGNINIRNFTIGNERQKVNARGYYSIFGNSDLNLTAERIKLSDIQLIFNPKLRKDELFYGDIRKFNFAYKGTFDEPDISVNISTDVLGIKDLKFGKLDANVSYKENQINPNISFFNPNNIGKLLINGSIPASNPFKGKASEDEVKALLSKDVSLTINADKFDVRIFERLIEMISQFKGTMNGTIKVGGNLEKPMLTGSMKLDNGIIATTLNDVKYNFNTELTTNQQKLIIGKTYLNPVTDKSMKTQINGFIDFTNMEFNNLGFEIKGDLKLFDKSITQNMMGIYGDLNSSVYLTLTGNSDRLDLKGEINVLNGHIEIIPAALKTYNIYSDNIIYAVDIDSTSYEHSDSIRIIVENLKSKTQDIDPRDADPFEALFIERDTISLEKEKNIFYYDIKVNTQRQILVDFLIDETTKQSFNGNVSANLYVNNYEKDSLNVRGRVDIGNNSYYKFYKNFETSGYIMFNGALTNPELNVKAIYNAKTTKPDDPLITRIVEVRLEVTGTGTKPILKWNVYVDGASVGGADPTDQAISFLIFGRLKDELSAGQKMNLFSSVGANVGATIASSYLSSFISSYLPFIVNTDISYVENSGNLSKSTDIRFTATLGGAVIRVGGQILNDITNTNFVIEYPLDRLLNLNKFNNLIVKVERLVDPYSQSNRYSSQNRVGALLIYKIKF